MTKNADFAGGCFWGEKWDGTHFARGCRQFEERKLSYNLNSSCMQSILELHSCHKSKQTLTQTLVCSSKESKKVI